MAERNLGDPLKNYFSQKKCGQKKISVNIGFAVKKNVVNIFMVNICLVKKKFAVKIVLWSTFFSIKFFFCGNNLFGQHKFVGNIFFLFDFFLWVGGDF
jgi:hypothetical protein